jgi:hypothetical protein
MITEVRYVGHAFGIHISQEDVIYARVTQSRRLRQTVRSMVNQWELPRYVWCTDLRTLIIFVYVFEFPLTQIRALHLTCRNWGAEVARWLVWGSVIVVEGSTISSCAEVASMCRTHRSRRFWDYVIAIAPPVRVKVVRLSRVMNVLPWIRDIMQRRAAMLPLPW